MLLEELVLTYAYVGCCIVEKNPFRFSLVLRAVGLVGVGEAGIGDDGDRSGVRAKGDFNDRFGRLA